jgi:hypothetical protein
LTTRINGERRFHALEELQCDAHDEFQLVNTLEGAISRLIEAARFAIVVLFGPVESMRRIGVPPVEHLVNQAARRTGLQPGGPEQGGQERSVGVVQVNPTQLVLNRQAHRNSIESERLSGAVHPPSLVRSWIQQGQNRAIYSGIGGCVVLRQLNAVPGKPIRMLQYRYRERKDAPDEKWKMLETLLKRLNLQATAVLSLNWDCVVERGLARTQGVDYFDYGCDARAAVFAKDKLAPKNDKGSTSFQLLKPHGSINWLYCDACRQLYWLPPNQTEQVAQTLFRKRDWTTVATATKASAKSTTLNPPCPDCGSYALGTRLATFSYRKALDFPMHAATWRRAEVLLREAETWIFFGYSMPGADFEFKHLLKRVELSRKKKPHIVLVTGGDGATITKTTYENFFGSDKYAPRAYHFDGLTAAVIKDLTGIGVLRPTQIKRPSQKRV